MEKEKRNWEALASELRKLLEWRIPNATGDMSVRLHENRILQSTSVFIDPKPGHEDTSLTHHALEAVTDFCRCKGLHAVVRAHTDYNNNALWRVIIG